LPRIYRIILFLFLSACAGIQTYKYKPVDFKILTEIKFDFKPVKAVYSPIENTLFVMESRSSRIHIYKDGLKINQIGGLGAEKSKFLKLTDITVSFDGSLLALDSVQKKIIKFDPDGKRITEYGIDFTLEPVLLEVSRDGKIFIYDNKLGEVFLDRSFTRERFKFGKFTLKEPQQMILTENELLIYDSGSNTTKLFDILGKLINEQKGLVQKEKGNVYLLDQFYFEDVISGSKFAVSSKKWNFFQLKSGYCVLLSNDSGVIGKINYEID